MKRHRALLAALFVVGATAATAAAAHNSFAVSIGAPGFAVGYASGGFGFAVAAPPVLAAPPAVYSGPAYPYVVPAPVIYGPRFAGYYGPYWRHRYWRH